jgi:hypothetical protein
MKANPISIGVTLGLALAAFHAAWAALVAIGWAQGLMNFIFWAHFIVPVYHVEPFEIERAIVLLGVVFVSGLVFGTTGGWLWNRVVVR